MKYSIYFIIQPGELEIQSLLLLSTLRAKLRGEYQVFAFSPKNIEMDLEFQSKTIEILNSLEIPIINTSNPYLNWKKYIEPGDLYSNKYIALPHLTESDYTIFFDSDMLLMRDLNFSTVFHDADFFAKPVCYYNEHRWDDLYGLFNLEIPMHRIRSTVDNQEGPPYFNAGLFAIRSRLAEDLSTCWLDTIKTIDNSQIMKDNLIYREQVALSIAVIRMQLSYNLLTEDLNYPARSKQLTKKKHPHILHYHDPESIYKTTPAYTQVKDIFKKNIQLRDIANGYDNWKILTSGSNSIKYTSRRIKYRLKGLYQTIFLR